MNKLLHIEYLKISHYKTGKFFIIAYFAILCLAAFGMSQHVTVFGAEIDLGKFGVFNFPHVWHFITYFADFAKLFLAIIIITTVTNEFSFGTIKQNLIDGLTKKEFVLSKTLTAIVLSLVSTVFVAAISLVLGHVFTEGSYSMFQEMEYIPVYFLKLISFFSFCIFLSILLRKSAFVFALLFVWWIAESILSGIELFVRSQIMNMDMVEVGGRLYTDYLPLSSMSKVIPSPFKRIETLDMATHGQMHGVEISPVFIILCMFYFVLFTFLSYRLVQKRDL